MTTKALAIVRQWLRRDEGQDLLEYGLLASLIATFVVGAMTQVGERVHTVLWAAIAAARF